MTPELTVLLAVLGLALATMSVYALGAARSTADPQEVVDRGSFVLRGFLRSWFYWFIGPLVRVCLNSIGALVGVRRGKQSSPLALT